MAPWLVHYMFERLGCRCCCFGLAALGVAIGLAVSEFGSCGSHAAEQKPELRMASFSFLVLPFANPSGDAGQDYIAANITGDLTAGLSGVEGSFVIARSSALAIASQLLAVDEIGRRFGIRFVLRGSASVADRRLHVTATLLRTEDGQQVWSTQFERDFVALRRLEREIIDEIAHQLGATIADAASVHLSASVPDAGALDASLRANAALDMPQTAKTLGEARRLFETALQADPHAVEAKAGLAAVHLASALSSWGSGLAIELQQCERLVQQVLTTEPRHPHALSILGALRRATNRRHEALAAYEAVLAADRNDANAHAQIGRLKIDLGEAHSALPHIELALRLSPLDAQRSLWFTFAGLALLYTGQPKMARQWLEKSVAAAPQFVTALVFLGVAQELDGQDADARRTIEEARRINPSLSIARVERQFAPDEPRALAGWSPIADSLRRIGLPN